jgi:hypothetical protein
MMKLKVFLPILLCVVLVVGWRLSVSSGSSAAPSQISEATNPTVELPVQIQAQAENLVHSDKEKWAEREYAAKWQEIMKVENKLVLMDEWGAAFIKDPRMSIEAKFAYLIRQANSFPRGVFRQYLADIAASLIREKNDQQLVFALMRDPSIPSDVKQRFTVDLSRSFLLTNLDQKQKQQIQDILKEFSGATDPVLAKSASIDYARISGFPENEGAVRSAFERNLLTADEYQREMLIILPKMPAELQEKTTRQIIDQAAKSDDPTLKDSLVQRINIMNLGSFSWINSLSDPARKLIEDLPYNPRGKQGTTKG